MRKCVAVLRELVLPIGLAVFLGFVFRPVYFKDGNMDYFLMWILIGFPYGIRRMWLWLIPQNYGLAGTLGIIALNVIVGGIIGGFAILFQIVRGLLTLIKCFSE